MKTQTCDLYCPEAELPVPDTCIVEGGGGGSAGQERILTLSKPFHPSFRYKVLFLTTSGWGGENSDYVPFLT